MTPESLVINATNGIIHNLRKVRDNLIFQLQFKSAVFLSDKILALRPSTEDYAVLAKCLYCLKEYQRAAYIITCRNLHHTDISCCLLVIKCYVRVYHITTTISVSLHYLVLFCLFFYSSSAKTTLKRQSWQKMFSQNTTSLMQNQKR